MDYATNDNDHADGSIDDDVLHDVRNRLTVIKGVAQMLDRQIRRDDWQRDKIVGRVDRLQEEIARLEALVGGAGEAGMTGTHVRQPKPMH